jgi:hypothetical protein
MYRPMKYGYSRFPIDLGIMLSQPLDWEISADTPLELANFPADILLVVTDAHGQRRGIFLARTLDGHPIGTGHFYGIRPLDPRQFMLKHKLRVHNGPGAAGIHEKVPFTLAILTILVYPVQNCSDKQAFSMFGGRRLGRFPFCFSLCETHFAVDGSSTFEAFRHLDRAQRLAGIRNNGEFGISWYTRV